MAPTPTGASLPHAPLGKRPADAATPPPPGSKKARRSSASCDAASSQPPLVPPHAPLSPAAAALIPALVSPTTADEMEQFLETCVQWQTSLARASRTIDAKAARLEQREVALVLDALVAQVELRALTEQAAELEALRAAATQQACEAERAVRRMQQQQEEREAFEALERRLLDDRVTELEVQLAQHKLRAAEKDDAIARLRAEQDEASALHHQSGAQARELAALQDELAAAGLKVQELEDKLAVALAQEETRAFEDVEKSILEERIHELTAQLKAPSCDASQVETTERQEQVRASQLAEELEAAQMQLSVAEAEANVKKNEVARLLNDKAALKKQAKALAVELKRTRLDVDAYKAQIVEERACTAQLAEEKRRLQGELDVLVAEQQQHLGTSASELVALQQEVKHLREQEQLRADDNVRREEELERLAWKERTLTKQLGEAAEREAAVRDALTQLQEQHDQQLKALQQHPSREALSATSSESAGESTDERAARLELEKREILDFFRCYFEASETKCRQLMRELSQQQDGVSGSSSSSGGLGTVLDGVATLERIP